MKISSRVVTLFCVTERYTCLEWGGRARERHDYRLGVLRRMLQYKIKFTTTQRNQQTFRR